MTQRNTQSMPNVDDMLDTLDSLYKRHMNLINDMQGYICNRETLRPHQKIEWIASASSVHETNQDVPTDAEADAFIRDSDSPKPEKEEEAANKSIRPKSKVRNFISATLFYGLLICLISSAFLISQGNKKPVFGYSFMNVLTWSMQSEIPQGSMVVIKQVDPNTIQIGDDITYMKDAETSVTHRVTGITESFEDSGERGFETQGIENDTPDFEIVPAVNVVGVVKLHIPLLGGWLEWLRAHLIITLVFAIGFILLITLLKGAFKKNPEESKTRPSKSRRPKTSF